MYTEIELERLHCTASYKTILLSTKYPGFPDEDNPWITYIMKEICFLEV